MNFQEIKEGRERVGSVTSKDITTTASILVSPSPTRVSLIIPPCAAARLTLSDRPGVVDQQGFVLVTAGPMLELNVADHGSLVTKGLYAVVSAGTATVSFFEAHDMKL